MAVPWLQIVQLVPSIVDVSRELLKRSKRMPPGPPEGTPDSIDHLSARVATLEENERRQAELVGQMAEQLAGVARAITALHRRIMWLTAAAAAAVVLALAAVALAVTR